MNSVRSRAVPAREAVAAYRDGLPPSERAEYDAAVEHGRRMMWAAIEGREQQEQPSPARRDDLGTF